MSSMPVSELIRQGGISTEDGIESGKRKSKDEYKRQKDLEEQRKAGTAPAMVDVETGRDINPHIPEFIEKAPWYITHSGPTLKHQRPHQDRQKTLATIAEWYPKGTTDRVAFKYRDGACENCGAMGHTKKTCFEKPRMVGAKWSNSNIAPDDYVLPKLEMNYDAKRDRWNGYNPEDYKFVMDEFDKMDETRRLIRAELLKETGEESKLDEDEDIYAEDASAPGQSIDMDSRTRITVRNLRIREDTAKYLYNLDPNSPFYDPKSRSMRENPLKNVPGKEQEAAQLAGENFMKFTGEVTDANEAQVFAWQARCKGIDVHSLAEPTRLEALKREYEKQKEEKKSSVKNELIEKYGGKEHLSAPPKELLLAQTENYIEYNRKGKVIKGDIRPPAKSRYDEDNFPNNHTSVWGSYWRDGRWGFACCHQFLRNSYCIGEQGILAEQAELGPNTLRGEVIGAGKNSIPSTEMQNAMKQQMSKKVDDEEEEWHKQEESETQGKKSKKKRKSANGDESDSASNSGSNSVGFDKEEEAEGEEMNEEERQRYEEQLEVERQKKKREEKRRETRREKRKRQKEKAKRRDPDGKNGKKKRSSSLSSAASDGRRSSQSPESSDDDSKKKYSKEVRKAIREQRKQRAEGKAMAEQGDRKRKYHHGLDTQRNDQNPSTADQEAYNLTRIHSADPMAQFFEEKEQKRMDSKRARKQPSE